MKITPLQKAFLPYGKSMLYGAKAVPTFDHTLSDIQQAIDAIASQLPALRAGVVDGKVVIADRIVITEGHPELYHNNPTCLRVSYDNGYWVTFTHDFIDGWSFATILKDIFETAKTGMVKNYQWVDNLPAIAACEPFKPKSYEFDGTEGIGYTKLVPISNAYLGEAKRRGYRAQDYLAHIAFDVIGPTNVVTTKLIPGREHHIGHNSMYGSGSVVDGRFTINCSHETTTRLMMARGLGNSANCFVGSTPLGKSNYKVVDFIHYFRSCQLGRIQTVSQDEEHTLRIALNSSIQNPDYIVGQILDRLGE